MSTKEITQIVVVTVKYHTIQDRGEQNIPASNKTSHLFQFSIAVNNSFLLMQTNFKLGSNPIQAWIFFFRSFFHYCSSSVHYCKDQILTVRIIFLFYQYVLTVEVSSHPLTPKISSVVLLTVYHKNSHDVSSKSPIWYFVLMAFFSSLVCFKMHYHYKENYCLDQLVEDLKVRSPFPQVLKCPFPHPPGNRNLKQI